jgi:hypothetical protein
LDLDKAPKFPANYVCVLPSPKNWTSSTPFVKIFGENSAKTATGLLTEALKETRDSAVKFEIEKKLKELKNRR